MRYIVPATITDGMLASSSVPETDHAAWSAVTAYGAGDRCIRVATHSVYERLVPGTTGATPESDVVNWARVAPTNRWAMLDGAVGTATEATDTISITLTPGVVRGLALLDMDVERVVVEMTVSGETVYRAAIDPIGTQEDCDNFFDYFFEAIQRRRVVILTDLPPFGEGLITITATGSGAISIGSCVIGAMYDIGETQADVSIGITDYSRKEVDDFGVTTVAERAYTRRMSVPIVLPTNVVDVASARLARVRAKPVVWIGSTALESLVIYGFLKDWSIDIPGRMLSTCTLQIEGLV